MKTDVPLLLRLGGIGLLIVGTLVSLVLSAAWLESRNVREWPAVDAHVIQSEIEVSKKIVPLGRSRRTHIDFFALRIEYEYEVNGERFTGNRMSLASNPCGYDRAEIEQWTRKFPLGATIPVHYSPAHPERSVVECTGGPGPMGLAFGILAILGGLAMRHAGKRMQPTGQTPVRSAVPKPTSTRTRPREEVGQPVLTSRTGGQRVSRRMHWSIRILGVLLGLRCCLSALCPFPLASPSAFNRAERSKLARQVMRGWSLR